MIAPCRWWRRRSALTWATPAAAIAQVKLMLKGTAEDRDVYIALSQMYSRIKDWPQAEASINKAMELVDQARRQGLCRCLSLGSIYERQKKYELAEESVPQSHRDRSQRMRRR